MITTGDDFRSNYIDGYADAFTGKEFDKRFSNHAGYGEGFSAFELGDNPNRDELTDMADEAWFNYSTF